MNEKEWKKLQTQQHIREIVSSYAKIKPFFANEKTLESNRNNYLLEYGVEKIKANLIQLKTKLEKYRKTFF